MRTVAILAGVFVLSAMSLGMMPEGEDTPGFEAKVTSSGLN